MSEPVRATAKAPDRSHPHPLAIASLALWLYGQDGDALSTEDIAASPRLRASLDPSGLSGLVPGSIVADASGGAPWYANGSGTPVQLSAPGGTDVAVADGGTGASTAAGARTNLGLAIGSNVQAYNANLTSYATVAPGAFALTLFDDTTQAAAQTTLGLGTGDSPTFAGLHLNGIGDSPMTAASAVAGSGTIALPVGGDFRALSSASAVTGVILAVGTVAGQRIYLCNVNASDAITFDTTPATSHVAQSVCGIAAKTCKGFFWNATLSLWFPIGV